MRTMRVAVMQPYFMPYAGYFRLFAAVDMFIAFDCVQFPRRGWVHRNRFTNASGELDWLTLPLEKADRDTTRICDLRFREDSQAQWLADTRRFPCLQALHAQDGDLAQQVFRLGTDAPDYIVGGLLFAARLLGLERPTIRSSSLAIDPGLRSQERIIEIVRCVGGRQYLNPPGGRSLYDASAFRRAGLSLRFLSDYSGPFHSILERLIQEPIGDIRNEIHTNVQVEDAR
jgi:hypothetical protein